MAIEERHRDAEMRTLKMEEGARKPEKHPESAFGSGQIGAPAVRWLNQNNKG